MQRHLARSDERRSAWPVFLMVFWTDPTGRPIGGGGGACPPKARPLQSEVHSNHGIPSLTSPILLNIANVLTKRSTMSGTLFYVGIRKKPLPHQMGGILGGCPPKRAYIPPPLRVSLRPKASKPRAAPPEPTLESDITPSRISTRLMGGI